MNRPDLAFRAAGLALATALLAGLTAPAARAELVAVSPGERDRAVEATSACPTFSWSASPGATGYELVALRLDRGAEPEVVWTRTVAGSATSWSPSRGDCLEAGGNYAWTFRALGPDPPSPDSRESEWAAALRFHVPGAPSDEEVAAALATLERWRDARGTGSPGFDRLEGSHGPAGASAAAAPRPISTPSPRRAPASAPGGAGALSLASGVAAIRGENPDSSGSALGLLGVSHSPAGAAVVARNESAGADLVLDGEANGASDTLLRQDSLDRPSANPESFDFRNSGSGTLALKIDGVDVVTTATDQDTLGALSCPDGQIAKRISGAWQCASDADSDTTYLAGNQLQLTGSTFDVLEGPASGLDADTVDGLDSTALAAAAHGHFGASWTGNGAALTVENLGTTGNLSSLVSRTYTETGAAVYGQHGHPTAEGYGVYGLSNSSQGIGVQGVAARYGVRGVSTAPANGYGIVGFASGTSGAGTFGGAYNATGDMIGVLGLSSQSPQGVGVKGESQATSGSAQGVWGVASSPSGTGVRGQATATTGATRGVYGETASAAGGIGVYGKATSTTGLNFGVVGEAPSPDSIGVHGLATATLGNPWGVYGETRSTSTNGVNPRATAVYGLATGTSGDALGVAGGSASLFGAGVYGFNSGGGFAGYYQGKVHVNGTLSKAGGSFKIDHPLDPENRYLSHSFVESPDMMNLYNGNATLDANGEAWVVLPDWFEALNRDFRYQLTPLGSWAALWIEREIEGNRFLIRGGAHSRVSWQVTGVRHDAWAEAHRIPTEEAKPEGERGLYLHPEAWGQPAAKGLHRLDANEPARTEGVRFESSGPASPAAFAKLPPALPDGPEARGETHGQR